LIKKAIVLNPSNGDYWEALSRVLYPRQSASEAFQALQMALYLNPHDTDLRWRAGNLYLQGKKKDRAVEHYLFLVRHSPTLRQMAFAVLDKLISCEDLLANISGLNKAIREYLHFLITRNSLKDTVTVWSELEKYKKSLSATDYKRFIRFLIRHKDFKKAFHVWSEALAVRDINIMRPSPENLVTDGGFESIDQEDLGFQWSCMSIKGARVVQDSEIYREGSRALRIVFNGQENPNFSHVRQFVYLEAPGEYRFDGFIKTEGITTTNGIFIEIIGYEKKRMYLATPTFTGTHPWKNVRLPFKTSEAKTAVLLRVRRKMSRKFDKFIDGTVWIDSFRITRVNGE
jgi:hypothetical protein